MRPETIGHNPDQSNEEIQIIQSFIEGLYKTVVEVEEEKVWDKLIKEFGPQLTEKTLKKITDSRGPKRVGGNMTSNIVVCGRCGKVIKVSKQSFEKDCIAPNQELKYETCQKCENKVLAETIDISEAEAALENTIFEESGSFSDSTMNKLLMLANKQKSHSSEQVAA